MGCFQKTGFQFFQDPARWWDDRGKIDEVPELKTALQVVAALRRCSKLRDLNGGKKLHLDAVVAGLHTDNLVAANLITMYSKCRSMALAQHVFEELVHRDASTWSCLILGYVQNGENLAAMDLFNRIDCEPSCITYVAALKACGGLACEKKSQKRVYLEKGIAIHKQVKQRGFECDQFVANTLVDMYSKCGSMDRAKEVFDRMNSKDVVAWTSLILGYVQNGESLLAIDLFAHMDCEPDGFTYAAVLKACGGLASETPSMKLICLDKGIAIHNQVKKKRFDYDIFVASTLVNMYSKCGSMDRAREVFDRMVKKNVVTWNSLLLGYVQNGESSVAMNLFARIDCQADYLTYVAALKACKALGSEKKSEKQIWLEKAILIHRQAKERGFACSMVVANTLVDMYSKFGKMDSAREIFDKMKHKDVASWTCLILGYVQNEECEVAMDLFTRMDCEANSVTYVAALKACAGLASQKQKEFCLKDLHKKVKERGFDSDILVASSLVDMYSKCGNMEGAREVFDRMPAKNAVTWTSLILGYVQNGKGLIAMDLFASMDCEPDSLTYLAALKACGSLSAVTTGRQIHAAGIVKQGLEQDRTVVNNLMDFYGKCGMMSRAEELFSNLHSPDIVSWNTLMAGYSSFGDSSQVLRLVKELQAAGLQMDGITFIFVLTACSHAGLIEQGKSYFNSMLESAASLLSLDHYNVMVDMLGRANRLQEALGFVKSMPFNADLVTWRTLLAACRKWKNLQVGRVAFDALANTEDSAAAYVLMSDIYTNLGMWQDLEHMEFERKAKKRASEEPVLAGPMN